MKPSFCVHVTLVKANGQRQEKTIPAEDYTDASATAVALNTNRTLTGRRRAEVCIGVLLHDRTLLLPFKMLPDIQDAIAMVLEEETRPTAAPKSIGSIPAAKY